MANRNFKCKYCSHHSTITKPDQFSHWVFINMNESTYGNIGLIIRAITCPNPDCKKLTIGVELTNAVLNIYNKWELPNGYNLHQEWQLLPESEAIVLPNYIPVAIKQDYYEACRIRDLSPKASATLARRCLQGMIRDFFKVSKNTLYAEIDAIKDKVDPDVYKAIDAVRQVGNIGAHMENDINMIINVEPGEAQLLIQLIEDLIKDWYITRKNREDRSTKINELVNSKKVHKKNTEDQKVENPFSDPLDDIPF